MDHAAPRSLPRDFTDFPRFLTIGNTPTSFGAQRRSGHQSGEPIEGTHSGLPCVLRVLIHMVELIDEAAPIDAWGRADLAAECSQILSGLEGAVSEDRAE
jgi:hypothetical protein